MKKIVIYYSLEGNTRLIAETIADTLSTDILEIKPVKEIPSKGFFRYVWGGAQVAMRKEPELLSIDKDLNDYAVVIIGSPVWNGSYTPPVRSFLKQNPLKGKKIVYFASSGGKGGSETAMQNFAKIFSDNEVLGEKAFVISRDNKKEATINEARNWAKTLVK